MKKLILIFVIACLGLAAMAQAIQIDTVNVGATANNRAGDPLRTAFLKINRTIVYVRDSIQGNLVAGSTIYAKLLPDTVHVTAEVYTVLATDANKVVVFENNFTLVTIDTYANQAIPVNSWTTFVNMGGVVKFTGTNITSELDSLCLDYIPGMAHLWKRGQNNNIISGSLR